MIVDKSPAFAIDSHFRALWRVHMNLIFYFDLRLIEIYQDMIWRILNWKSWILINTALMCTNQWRAGGMHLPQVLKSTKRCNFRRLELQNVDGVRMKFPRNSNIRISHYSSENDLKRTESGIPSDKCQFCLTFLVLGAWFYWLSLPFCLLWFEATSKL